MVLSRFGRKPTTINGCSTRKSMRLGTYEDPTRPKLRLTELRRLLLTVLKFRTVTSQVQGLEAAIEDSNASGGAPPQSAWESRPLAVAMSTKPHSSHPWKLEIRTSSPSDFIICLLDYLLRIPIHYLCRTKLHRPTLPNPQTHTFIQKEERGQEIHSALRLEYRLYTLQFRAWASRVPTTISQHERQILGLACKSSKCTKTTVVQPCPFDESCLSIDSQY